MLHPTLELIKNELEQLVAVVKSSTNEQRPPSLIHNQFGMPGIDRDELAERAEQLAQWIASVGGDTVGDYDSRLSQYPARLLFLRNNVAHFWNGNAANAVPAFCLTLDSLERALRPVLSVDTDGALEAGRAMGKLRTTIRSLAAKVDGLQPRADALQQMADGIVRAHEAAERLPTDLQELREARAEIQSIRDHADQDQAKVREIAFRATLADSSLAESSGNADQILEKCESALRASTNVGLAGAFQERADSLKTSIYPWVGGLVVALGLGAYFGGQQFHQLTETIQTSTSPTTIWTRLAVSLLSVGAPIWFAWLATKQIGQRFRLAEDYGYKAAVSKAYEGYRREAVELDEEFQKRLFASALTRLDEQPLRFVEHETHGSPWHELLSSDVFKQAIRIAPGLVSQFADMAKDTVESARALKRKSTPRVKAATDEVVE
jgi:nucleotide-binding universal stress UspA family protein